MDYKEIDFDPALSDDFKECLNNTFVRKDRVYCYCALHECYVSRRQTKNRNCKNGCVHKREPDFTVNKRKG